MLTFPRKIIKKLHPESIPALGAIFYNKISAIDIFQKHYELVAQDLDNYLKKGKVLDIGTGPAWLLLKIFKISPHLQLTGMDVSKSMVKKAIVNVEKAELTDKIKIVTANASDMPFPDNSFDAVISTGSLHHWKDLTGCLNEIYRILNPGKYALIYDLASDPPKKVLDESRKKFGRFRTWLMWLHGFEEPFYSRKQFPLLAEPTHFKDAKAKFIGALCCLILKKPDG